ncbi:hypothetical protein E2562_037872 [Oryza meyeriana var. granulata]|uniref:Uncharacterized protein n=1 Tax=Oryza meyeriana var. granulata TaxID=110450 RepID=A0A6G1ETZ0_9ORYZ|nr:hypothetical protein E2562_037872 [Oryza meyeriana var. granulata]
MPPPRSSVAVVCSPLVVTVLPPSLYSGEDPLLRLPCPSPPCRWPSAMTISTGTPPFSSSPGWLTGDPLSAPRG